MKVQNVCNEKSYITTEMSVLAMTEFLISLCHCELQCRSSNKQLSGVEKLEIQDASYSLEIMLPTWFCCLPHLLNYDTTA